MTRRTVHHEVAEAGKAAGIEFPVHLHMLHHIEGYYLANNGQDIRHKHGLCRKYPPASVPSSPAALAAL
jgi:site-specific recombinase XerD